MPLFCIQGLSWSGPILSLDSFSINFLQSLHLNKLLLFSPTHHVVACILAFLLSLLSVETPFQTPNFLFSPPSISSFVPHPQCDSLHQRSHFSAILCIDLFAIASSRVQHTSPHLSFEVGLVLCCGE